MIMAVDTAVLKLRSAISKFTSPLISSDSAQLLSDVVET